MERKAERKVTEGTDGASSTSEIVKTVSTLKQNHGKCTTKMTFANDKMAGEAKGNLVDDDGWKTDITLAGEIKQAKSEWKITGKLDAKTPDMGGAKAALNVSLTKQESALILYLSFLLCYFWRESRRHRFVLIDWILSKFCDFISRLIASTTRSQSSPRSPPSTWRSATSSTSASGPSGTRRSR